MKTLVFSGLLCSSLLSSLMSAQSIVGEYHLQGIPETASGFRFTPDGRFEFFFIYGAVDRMATGTYTQEGNTVKLKSDKEPGKDFPVTLQKRKGTGYTIQVKDPNEYLLWNIRCMYYIGDEKNIAYTDEKGLIHLDIPRCDKLYLVHELFIDYPSLIKDENNPNTYFEVTLSPSLANCTFKGVDFTLDGDTLTCLPNYFMMFENIRYVKL